MSIPKLTGFRPALLGALFLAVVSTVGDWIWARWIPQGRMIHGVVHGVVVFAAVGLVLGLAARARGAVQNVMLRAVGGEVLIGIAVSASFYPLYRILGIASLFITWMALWLLTALLQRRLMPEPMTTREALLRGLTAAVLSGLAFWAISGIWTDPPPGGPNYPFFLACWFFAFIPGFLALLLHSRE